MTSLHYSTPFKSCHAARADTNPEKGSGMTKDLVMNALTCFHCLISLSYDEKKETGRSFMGKYRKCLKRL